MAVRIGSTPLRKAYFGPTEVSEIYFGSTRVWQSVTPLVGGKWTVATARFGSTSVSDITLEGNPSSSTWYWMNDQGSLVVKLECAGSGWILKMMSGGGWRQTTVPFSQADPQTTHFDEIAIDASYGITNATHQ